MPSYVFCNLFYYGHDVSWLFYILNLEVEKLTRKYYCVLNPFRIFLSKMDVVLMIQIWIRSTNMFSNEFRLGLASFFFINAYKLGILSMRSYFIISIIVFHRPQNFEPSCGICRFPWDSAEFNSVWCELLIDYLGHVTNDTISDALLVYLKFIKIVALLIDFVQFSSYCLTALKIMINGKSGKFAHW